MGDNVKIQLRDTYLRYMELKSKGQLNIRKLRASNVLDCELQSQEYFFKPSESIQFQHPEQQIDHYNNLINSFEQTDHYPELKSIESKLSRVRFCRENIKSIMLTFFMRRLEMLKLKKRKMCEQNYSNIRVQPVDTEIINLQKRIDRIQIDECMTSSTHPQSKTHTTIKDRQFISNFMAEDFDLYARCQFWYNRIKRPFKSMKHILSQLHYLNRFEIQTRGIELLSSMAEGNIKANTKYYESVLENIENKLKLKIQYNAEVAIVIQKLLKPLRFNVPQQETICSLSQRFDRVPLRINGQEHAIQKLRQTAQLYLRSNPKVQILKLVTQMNNLTQLYEGIQKYLGQCENPEPSEYQGVSGFSRMMIELLAFDDAKEVKEQLLEPLLMNELHLKLVQTDWKVLIPESPIQCLIKDKFSLVSPDVTTNKIIQLLSIKMCGQIRTMIDEQTSSQTLILDIYDNYPYCEKTKTSLRLAQINELFSSEITYPTLQLKQDLQKALEAIFKEDQPHPSILRAHYNVQVCKMRDYRRKILNFINAQNSLVRKISQTPCLEVINTEFLMKVQYLKTREEGLPQVKTTYPYSTKLRFNNDSLPEVFVESDSGDSLIFMVSLDHLSEVMSRICQQISLYIQKYEKLNVVKSQGPLVDRFQCILDCLELEANYQFNKLRLMIDYVDLHDKICDPIYDQQSAQKILELWKSIPLLDPHSIYFKDSYNLNIKLLVSQRIFIQKIYHNSIVFEKNELFGCYRRYHLIKGERILPVNRQEMPKKVPINQNSAYDQYQIGDKMAKIFEELNASKKGQTPIESQREHKTDLEGLPFDGFLDSAWWCLDQISIANKTFEHLNESFPQQSISALLALKIAVYEIALEQLPDFHMIEGQEYHELESQVQKMHSDSELEKYCLVLEQTRIDQRRISILSKLKVAFLISPLQISSVFFSVNKNDRNYKDPYVYELGHQNKQEINSLDSVEQSRIALNYELVALLHFRYFQRIMILQSDVDKKMENDLIQWHTFSFLNENAKVSQLEYRKMDFSEKSMLDSHQQVMKQRLNEYHLAARRQEILKFYEKRMLEKKISSEEKQTEFKFFLQQHLILDLLRDCQQLKNLINQSRVHNKISRLLSALPGRQPIRLAQAKISDLFIDTKHLDTFNVNAQISNIYAPLNYISIKNSMLDKLIEYDIYLENFVMSQSMQLSWWDVNLLSELYLLNLNFQDLDMSKELENSVQNPMKALSSFDLPLMEVATSESDLIQRPVLNTALDTLLQRIKSFHAIRVAFNHGKVFSDDRFDKIYFLRSLMQMQFGHPQPSYQQKLNNVRQYYQVMHQSNIPHDDVRIPQDTLFNMIYNQQNKPRRPKLVEVLISASHIDYKDKLNFKLHDSTDVFLRDVHLQILKTDSLKPRESLLNHYLKESVRLLQNDINLMLAANSTEQLKEQLVSSANLPRMKLIECLTSSQSTGRQIPAHYKVGFIQGFLNRLRNKASCVELLSTGYGFVISAQDMEDCLNLLNRELYTFADREIEARINTFNYLYESQQKIITAQKEQIASLKLENQLLRKSFDERLSALVIAKSNHILFELQLLQEKHQEFTKYMSGLEEHIRAEMENRYKFEIYELRNERDKVIKKFDDFKESMTILCQQEVKIEQKTILNFIERKTAEILIDQPQFIRRHATLQIEQSQEWDPYKFTVGLHKLRDEFQKQLEENTISYEKQLGRYQNADQELQMLKLELSEAKRRENLLRLEIITRENDIKVLHTQKEQLSSTNESLEFDKKRLMKSLADLSQKMRSHSQYMRTVEIKRKNAISVDNMSNSVVNQSQLPSIKKPKLQLF